MKNFLQLAIVVYQKLLSPFLGNQCRFTPSCSCYMHGALEKHGAVKGLLLGIYRILRCNPFSRSSWIDPVPAQFTWRGFFRYNPPVHKQNEQGLK